MDTPPHRYERALKGIPQGRQRRQPAARSQSAHHSPANGCDRGRIKGQCAPRLLHPRGPIVTSVNCYPRNALVERLADQSAPQSDPRRLRDRRCRSAEFTLLSARPLYPASLCGQHSFEEVYTASARRTHPRRPRQRITRCSGFHTFYRRTMASCAPAESHATLLDALDYGAVWSRRGLAAMSRITRSTQQRCDQPRRDDENLADSRDFPSPATDQVPSWNPRLMQPEHLRARILSGPRRRSGSINLPPEIRADPPSRALSRGVRAQTPASIRSAPAASSEPRSSPPCSKTRPCSCREARAAPLAPCLTAAAL